MTTHHPVQPLTSTQASTSAATFGRRIPYGKVDTTPLLPGHQLQFGEALGTACEQIIFRWATPGWAYKLPIARLQVFLSHMGLAYRELEDHLRGLISDSRAKTSDATEKDEYLQDDLLRRLVAANDVESDTEKRLSDDELLSNVFVRFRVCLYRFDGVLKVGSMTL